MAATPTLPFQLTFAGIPFCIDTAQIVRMRQPQSDMENKKLLPATKFQSEVDLIEELDRILPFTYMNDFAYPDTYPGRNLGAVAHRSEIKEKPGPTRLYQWYYPTTASKWSIMYGLASSSLVKQYRDATQGGRTPATFIMKAEPSVKAPGKSYELSTSMYMLPPRPLAEHGGDYDGLYLVTLVDERYYFPGTPIELYVDSATTWLGLLEQLETALGVTINMPDVSSEYSAPELDSQLWSNGESAGILLDSIAYNIGRVVVRRLSGTYDLLTPQESQDITNRNRYNLGSYEGPLSPGLSGVTTPVYRVGGGDIFSPSSQLKVGDNRPYRNAIVPTNIKVYFPYYVVGDDPVPHFLNTRYRPQRRSCWYEESYGGVYAVEVPIASGGPAVSGLAGTNKQSFLSTAKALISGEANAASGVDPINVSGLRSMAMRLARDRYEMQVVSSFDEDFPGTVLIRPEGIHDIIWTYSSKLRRAGTRISRPSWTQTVDEFQHGAPPLSGETPTPRGVGGPSVAQTWSDRYGASGSFRGIGGPFQVSGFASSGMIVGSGPSESGFLITSGSYNSGALVGSGSIQTTLTQTLLSGETTAFFESVSYFPTGNRWRGRIGNEIILFEGTSGGLFGGQFGNTPNAVNVVYRSIDGTISPAQHDTGKAVFYVLPNQVYGVNLVEHDKGQFIHPSYWTSGGIQGAVVKPQTQTVQVLDGSGIYLNNILHYSGVILSYDPTLALSGPWIKTDYVWCVDRNAPLIADSGLLFSGILSGGIVSGTDYSGTNYSGGTFSGSLFSGAAITNLLLSGIRYDGQLLGYSIYISGRAQAAPIYGVANVGAGTPSFLAQLTAKFYDPYVIPVEGSGRFALVDPNFTPYSWIEVYEGNSGPAITYTSGLRSGGPGSGTFPAYHIQNIDYPTYPIAAVVATSGYLYSGSISGGIASGNPNPQISGFNGFSGGYYSGTIISGGGIQPLSIVRLHRGIGDYYVFDQNPWVDLFRRTDSSDTNGVIAYHRIWNQNSGLWQDGQVVYLILAE